MRSIQGVQKELRWKDFRKQQKDRITDLSICYAVFYDTYLIFSLPASAAVTARPIPKILCIFTFLIFGMIRTSTAAMTAIFTATLLSVGAADAFHAFFLFSDKVENDSTDDPCKYSHYNEIFHYALPRAYSALSF